MIARWVPAPLSRTLQRAIVVIIALIAIRLIDTAATSGTVQSIDFRCIGVSVLSGGRK
jgi:hypothetical protein